MGVFLITIISLFFLFLVVEAASEGEFGEWISDWVKSLIRKLPHPKN